MEDLSKQWTRLSLLDGEGDRIIIGKSKCSQEYIIVVKFLTRRALNVYAMGELSNHYGIHLMGLESRSLATICYYLFLIIQMMLTRCYSVSLGALTSIWWWFGITISTSHSRMYVLTKPLFGLKCMIS